MKRTPYEVFKLVLEPLKGFGLRKYWLVRKILAICRPHHITVKGHRIKIDAGDFSVSEQLIMGKYETFEAGLLDALIRERDTVIDMGANIGYFTTMFATLAKSGRIFAFEPSPGTFSILRQNMEQFSHVIPHQLALGESDGVVKLYLNDYNHGDNRIFPSFGVHGIDVPIRKLDDVLPQVTADFVKMDIQGSEVYAMRGMRGIFSRSQSMYMLVEFWPEGLRRAGASIEEFVQIIEQEGFSFVVVDGENEKLLSMWGKELISSLPNERTENGGIVSVNLLCWRDRELPDAVKRYIENR